jgi:hypothetical protein
MPARQYTLTVEGEVSNRVRSSFDGMSVRREDGNTVFAGPLRDEAELQGVLRRLSDLGLVLLAASIVSDRQPFPPAQPGGRDHVVGC